MSLISIIVVLAVIGFVAWLIMQIPMPPLIQKIILGVICLLVILWVLQQFGLGTGLGTVRIK